MAKCCAHILNNNRNRLHRVKGKVWQHWFSFTIRARSESWTRYLFQTAQAELTASVLIFSIGTVCDSITAQYGRQAEGIQTAVLSNGAAILRRDGAGQQGRAGLLVGFVDAVGLAVAPPAPWDALVGVGALVLVGTAGQRLRRHGTWEKDIAGKRAGGVNAALRSSLNSLANYCM